jgi:hypothetical protein
MGGDHQFWGTGISQQDVGKAVLYREAVLGTESRKFVGYLIDSKQTSGLVPGPLDMALRAENRLVLFSIRITAEKQVSWALIQKIKDPISATSVRTVIEGFDNAPMEPSWGGRK